ncbi:ricin-type beta-trefoil lectin domain protein [Planomonospora sp. ID91781]|uniref:RICIN domain-containing protein n=1 Tax=Planomonospora sp. ID91781 TaxID=2738135 RepID=UPI0018C35650|nr:ricin-type beta-trefoil lectin domain protein [Planomonospora sp. ID91781]MBG0823327.1 ricin-type beta-trefoil lectin domain protein [Planomonospora sp. ID91781]
MRNRIRTALMSMAVMAAAAANTSLASAPASAAVAAPIAAASATQATPAESGFVMESVSIGAQAAGYLRNRATGRCLEQGWDGHVFTNPCNYGPAQTWTWIGGERFKSLVNSWSQECLDGTSATGRVYTLSCNGGDYQKWSLGEYGHITQRQALQNLDSNWEGSVYLSPQDRYNTNNHQKWY